jgi:hypothetical protein
MVDNTEKHKMLNALLSSKTPEELTKLLFDCLYNPDAIDPEIRAACRELIARRKERIIRNNVKYDQLLTQITDKQSLTISKNDGNGYKINQVFFHKMDVTGNVAVMMVKDAVYDEVSGKVKQKIIVVYSDGTLDSTFEKKITIRKVL